MGERHVSKEVATVYRGGGRRFLSKASTYRAAAKTRLAEECHCCPPSSEFADDGDVCRFHDTETRHDGEPYGIAVIRRLAALYMRHDRRTPEESDQ